MKAWEKLLYAFAVLIGAFLFILWMNLVFFDRSRYWSSAWGPSSSLSRSSTRL